MCGACRDTPPTTTQTTTNHTRNNNQPINNQQPINTNTNHTKQRVYRLPDLWVRPGLGGRGRKIPGALEAHANGFRWAGRRELGGWD